jgi:hypothetical protein
MAAARDSTAPWNLLVKVGSSKQWRCLVQNQWALTARTGETVADLKSRLVGEGFDLPVKDQIWVFGGQVLGDQLVVHDGIGPDRPWFFGHPGSRVVDVPLPESWNIPLVLAMARHGRGRGREREREGEGESGSGGRGVGGLDGRDGRRK